MIIGDVVFLNSNPTLLMTVSYVLGQYPNGQHERDLDAQMREAGYQDRDVCCTWFNDKHIETGFFRERMVTKKR
jgi:Uncharacterized small protein (DUF2158).